MRFENPAALWGLASLVLLILFSLWRQAAAKVTVPSLLLWKKIPERNPPVRALRRPRWRLELLLQALAIASAVAALAKPYRETEEPKPRRIALVFDTSARLQAGDRLSRMKAKAGEITLGVLSHDVVTTYAAAPAPRKLATLDELRGIDAHVDLDPLLSAAGAASDRVILFSDVASAPVPFVSFGAPADNAGIVEFSISDDEAFVRIVNHGPPRPLPIELRAGELRIRETVPAGQRTWSHRADYSKAASVRVALTTGDSFPLDDAVEATRLAAGGALLTLSGRHHDALPKVFRAIPGVSVQRGGGGALVAVGWDEPPGPGELRVFLQTPDAPLKGEAAFASHPLLLDLDKRGSEMIFGELPAADRAGTALIRVGGKVAAAIRGKDVHLCIDLNAWQAMPSFPIFWVNVVDEAQKAARGLTVIRAGRPVRLIPNAVVEEAPAGAIRELTPEGVFVAYTAGAYRVKASGESKSLYVNLLDERESDTAGVSRDLNWDAGAAAQVRQRQDLAGPAAWAALIFLLLAWLLQLRPE
ncbi:MAG: BatA domain-containing protein [Planctomycetaceae bacterium]|nr:BatA domain-containing protein [Planctomycetaceae bacterium]